MYGCALLVIATLIYVWMLSIDDSYTYLCMDAITDDSYTYLCMDAIY